MKRILLALAGDASFLYAERGYRITDSRYHPSFGGVGHVTLSGEDLDLRFWLDRDRLFLEFRAKRGKKPVGEWYSTDIVRQRLTGEIDKDLIDHENLNFIRTHFDAIEGLFRSHDMSLLEDELASLKKQRAQRMFGN